MTSERARTVYGSSSRVNGVIFCNIAIGISKSSRSTITASKAKSIASAVSSVNGNT